MSNKQFINRAQYTILPPFQNRKQIHYFAKMLKKECDYSDNKKRSILPLYQVKYKQYTLKTRNSNDRKRYRII